MSISKLESPVVALTVKVVSFCASLRGFYFFCMLASYLCSSSDALVMRYVHPDIFISCNEVRVCCAMSASPEGIPGAGRPRFRLTSGHYFRILTGCFPSYPSISKTVWVRILHGRGAILLHPRVSALIIIWLETLAPSCTTRTGIWCFSELILCFLYVTSGDKKPIKQLISLLIFIGSMLPVNKYFH